MRNSLIDVLKLKVHGKALNNIEQQITTLLSFIHLTKLLRVLPDKWNNLKIMK